MKKIGIFLGYTPAQSLKQHGIGRLIALLLGQMLKNEGYKIVIAALPQSHEKFEELLIDHNIDIKKIEKISIKKSTLSFFINFCKNFKFKIRNIRKKIFEKSYRDKNKIASKDIETINFIVIIKLLTTCIKKIFLLVVYIFYKIFLSTAIKIFLFFKKKINIQNFKHKDIKINFSLVYTLLKNYTAAKELSLLIKSCNQRKDVDFWFAPAAFWPEFSQLKARKILTVPDIVMLEFPTLFKEQTHRFSFENVFETIHKQNFYICYSNSVKNNQLVKKLLIAEEKIHVIPHGWNDLSMYLKSKGTSSLEIRDCAVRIIKFYQSQFLHSHPYFNNYDFSDIKFIFYSSQGRKYKNILNFIKSYHKILREEFLNIKLILTADISSMPEIYNYIKEKNLEFDVISFTNISSSVLAALNNLAVCAINPTLFEGGFPFTFSEAYSVGTPSIMSAIPAVLEVIDDGNLKKTMLFDPYDIGDMVKKIKWGVQNREKLFISQKTLYEKLSKRTWEIVAKEYLDKFEKISYF